MSVLSYFSLEGKAALVTGGRRGIGRAIALAFAEAGADVAVCDLVVRGGELEAVAEEIQRLGRRSLAVQADCTKKPEVDNLVKRVVDELGGIDILVNNVGGPGGAVGPTDTPEEQWQKGMDVNLKSCYLCTEAVGKGIVERKKGGSIINIASVAGVIGFSTRPSLFPPSPSPNFSKAYNQGKAGVIQYTRVLAWELGRFGIRVNAISPGGMFQTEMTRMLWSDAQRMKLFEADIPLGRSGELAELATTALFLASEASGYITGQNILVDGGSNA